MFHHFPHSGSDGEQNSHDLREDLEPSDGDGVSGKPNLR
jgi:hypothetical protein